MKYNKLPITIPEQVEKLKGRELANLELCDSNSVLVDNFVLTCLPGGKETHPISKQETFIVYFKNPSNQQNKWRSKFNLQ